LIEGKYGNDSRAQAQYYLAWTEQAFT